MAKGSAAAALKVEPPTDGQDIARRTVAIKVRMGKLGNTRKVKTSQIECDTDKSLLRVSKRLFDSDEYRAIRNLDTLVRRFLADTALPFDTGVNLIPLEMVEMVDAKLTDFAKQREMLVEDFILVYPSLCAGAAESLRSLYNPFDYPGEAYVRAQFTFGWQYVSYGVPGQLKDLSTKIWREEREKAASMMTDAAEEIRQTLRAALLELVSKMRDRLDTPEGKPMVFAPACKNLANFLGTFDFRNVANDNDLQKLVEQARGMLSGVTPEGLKTAGDLRAKVRDGMDGLAKKLDTMVVAKPSRKIRLGDGDE